MRAPNACPVQRADPVAQRRLRPDDRLVKVPPGREADDCLEERVVHQRIEMLAGQPLGLRVPDLPDEVCVAGRRAHPRPELPPEVLADLLGDVEAPPVDPEADPVLGDLQHHRPQRRRVEVQLRERGQVPPGLVAKDATRGRPVLGAAPAHRLDRLGLLRGRVRT